MCRIISEFETLVHMLTAYKIKSISGFILSNILDYLYAVYSLDQWTIFL